MIHIVFGLHAYQPPTQSIDVLGKITDESYDRVLDVLEKSKSIICVDLAYSLYEQLIKIRPNTLLKYSELIASHKIYPVNTLAYHPIAAMVNPEIWIPQLYMNSICGYGVGCDGIFFPEMAINKAVVRVIPPGYKWTVASDAYTIAAPHNYIPTVCGFPVFLMPQDIHNKINTEHLSPELIINIIRDRYKDGYIVLWQDFESFGHHNNNINSFLEKFIKLIEESSDMVLATPEVLLNLYPKMGIDFEASSWAKKDNNPFFLWDGNGKNEWINAWWRNAKKIQSGCPLWDVDVYKSLYSCQTWMRSHGNIGLSNAGKELFVRLDDKYGLGLEKLSDL